eukprot:Skav223222  [mRNA]  locus=scaffold2231:113204:114771:- [translate_table: standard]
MCLPVDLQVAKHPHMLLGLWFPSADDMTKPETAASPEGPRAPARSVSGTAFSRSACCRMIGMRSMS